MAKPETDFRNRKVLPFLKTLKQTQYFSITQVAKSGDPDFLLNSNGYFVSLELKTRGGHPTLLQEKKLDNTLLVGGISLVANPDNWLGVREFLIDLDGGKYGKSSIQVPDKLKLQFRYKKAL